MKRPTFTALCTASLLVVLAGSGSTAFADLTSPSYAGSASCRPCHADQFSSWSSSLHADAMREASGPTAAAFKSARATFGKQAKSSIEFRGGVGARTALIREGAEGAADAKSHAVRYLLGRRPMEQYLVETTSGRLQALPVGVSHSPSMLVPYACSLEASPASSTTRWQATTYSETDTPTPRGTTQRSTMTCMVIVSRRNRKVASSSRQAPMRGGRPSFSLPITPSRRRSPERRLR